MFKKTILENGLRLVTVPMLGTGTATVLVLVGAGSKYETKKINGLSHFLEHMLFKGTEKRPTARDISATLDSIGGEFNAFTSKEYTGYYAKVDSRHILTAMDVVSDMYVNSSLDQKEIEKERGVIIEEINLAHDTPMRYVDTIFEDLLYGDQPAGWDILGPKENIQSVNRQDFANYMDDFYVGYNTILIIAGKIDESTIESQAKQFFGSIKKAEPKKRIDVIEQQESPQAKVFFKETSQTHFCLGARAYNSFDEKRFAGTLLAVILGGNMSSRLFMEIREHRGLAYYVRTMLQPYLDSGHLMTQAGVDTSKLNDAIKVTMDEYHKIAQDGVGEEEFTRAKEFVKGSTLLELESSDALAGYLGTQELLKKEILLPEQFFAKIEAVNVTDIKAVAKDIFQPQKINLALIGPFKDPMSFIELIK